MASDTTFGWLRRLWQHSYARDYVGFVLLLITYTLCRVFVEPFHRLFALDNDAIRYPYAEVERVSVPWNIFYAGVLPLLLLISWAIILRPGWHKAHVTILGLFICLALTSFLTDIVKNSVGRPRPDLLARCKPAEGTPLHKLVSIEVCTETAHHLLHDGWRSFPSGHSSFAFAGLGYLALFLAGQIHAFRPPHTDLARMLLVLSPLIGAVLIAISRCEDYRHDAYDVNIGSALGFAVAYGIYRKYYPNLRSSKCDAPFPSRPVAQANGYRKSGDEEHRIQSAGLLGLNQAELDSDRDSPE